MRTLLLAILIASLTFLPTIASANSEVETTAVEIYNTIMSPFCPGRLLNDCPSGSAAELREKIRTELESGKSKDQVIEEFYGTFGEAYRAAPENKGFGVFAWWTPVAFVLIGLGIIATWLKVTKQKNSKANETQSSAVSPEMQSRIEQELKRF